MFTIVFSLYLYREMNKKYGKCFFKAIDVRLWSSQGFSETLNKLETKKIYVRITKRKNKSSMSREANLKTQGNRALIYLAFLGPRPKRGFAWGFSIVSSSTFKIKINMAEVIPT